MTTMKRRTAIVLLVAVSGFVVAYWLFNPAVTRGTLPPEAVPASGGSDSAARSGEVIVWPTLVNQPAGPPRIDTGMLDDFGQPITVSCMSCHGNLEPNLHTRSGSDLTEFHQGLVLDHGGLSCLSCHNANNYNTLRLADGREVDYPDVHMMCAQCHAPQARDFARGAHGGAGGYWDQTRGPQTRKNCIDCHDPHAPAFPSMMPTFKPRDRFLNPPHDSH